MLGKKPIIYILLSAGLFCSTVANAKTYTVAVHLTRITAQKITTQDSCRLYFSVTEYPSAGYAKETRVPEYPLHWLVKELSGIKDVKVWQGDIPDDNSVNVVFALMDQQIPLLESDKLMGTIQIEITNKKNKITTVWCQPPYVDQTLVEQPDPKRTRFVMYGGEYPYAVEFKVRVNK